MSATGQATRLLALEVSTASVIAELERRGVETLLLKGPTIDRWIYRSEQLRGYGDIDLLVAPQTLQRAERTLRRMGYANRYDGVSPAFAEEHADSWFGEQGGLPVDLHRHLWGVGMAPHDAWERLWSERLSMPLGGKTVAVPAPPARALALALHAAHHGGHSPKSLTDLEQGIAVIDTGTWEQAKRLARDLDAERGMAAGLGLTEGGRALAEALELPPGDTGAVRVTAAVWSMPAVTEGVLRVADADGIVAKAALLRAEALPSRTFMRTRSPHASLARRGRRGLLASYVLRLGQIARDLPRAIVTARRHRR